MATSIWKKASDILGFTNVGNLFSAIGRGDWSRAGYEWAAMPYEYVQNIKNWDNDSPVSDANSAVTVSNDDVRSQEAINQLGNSNFGIIGSMINKDGSSNLGSISSLEDLGVLAAEALTGALPEITRQWNSAEAQKERDWQTEMSNTAYQRSVADMKAAGINPILAYTQGGASSYAGASGSATPSSASSVGSIMDGLAKIIKVVTSQDEKSDRNTVDSLIKFTNNNSAQRVSRRK